MSVFEVLARYDDIIRQEREHAIIRRWDENGGYLIGAFSPDPREPRVWYDEHGDSLDASQREEGNASGGLVGKYAHDAVREAKRTGGGR